MYSFEYQLLEEKNIILKPYVSTLLCMYLTQILNDLIVLIVFIILIFTLIILLILFLFCNDPKHLE